MTFISWLKKQKTRDDPIGDFARDTVHLLRHGGRYKPPFGSSDFRKWDENLMLSGCVQDAMVDSFVEYYAVVGLPKWLSLYGDHQYGIRFVLLCHCWNADENDSYGSDDCELCSVDSQSASRSVGLKRRFQVMKRDGYRCQLCGKSAKDGARLEIDHIHPVSKGGTNAIGNLQCLCFECNHGKRDEIL